MNLGQTSAAQAKYWRIALLVFCLCCAGLRLWAMAYLERTIDPAAAGGIGVVTQGYFDGPRWMETVASVDPNSDLARAGIKAGDRVSYDRIGDRWRPIGVAELIPLTVESAGELRQLTVRTSAAPESVTALAVAREYAGLLESWLAWAVAIALLWRRSDSGPIRALGFAMALYSISDIGNRLPGGTTQTLLQLSGSTILQTFFTISLLYFAIAFPHRQSRFEHAGLRWGFLMLSVWTLALGLFAVLFTLRLTPLQPQDWMPIFEKALGISISIMGLIAIGTLGFNWRRSTGEAKYRAGWIGAFVATMLFSGLVFAIATAFPGRTMEREIAISFANCLITILAMSGLAYAVLRHRVFGFGFALNRALVWSLVLAVLVLGVMLLRTLGAYWPVMSDPRVAAGVTVPLALMFSIAVPRLRVMADSVVQRVFFSNWRNNEEVLWGAAREAATLQGQEVLLKHYSDAISRFATDADVTVYHVNADACTPVATTVTRANAAPTALTLSAADLRGVMAHRLPAALAAVGGVDGVAIPIKHRDQVTGFLLMGTRPDSAPYRPDEVQAVARVTDMMQEDLQMDAGRTQAQLLEQKLAAELRAREAAQATSAAKSAFLATMSHEIRTPMNGVIGMSGLLLSSPLDARQRDNAQTIRDSAESLLTIINDILDFSKIEAGKMELEHQPFDLRECMRLAMDLVSVRATQKGLRLACDFAADVPNAVMGDAAHLRQILLNLLSNAVKFTEVGSVALNVSAPEPGRLAFSVRDTGIGLSQEGRERLFQRFSQADNSIASRYGGTGLGLAISRQLTELMGGSIGVNSAGPGQGCEFHLSIPALAAELALVPKRAAEAAVLLDPQMAIRHPLRILLAEDNGVNQKLAMRLLEQFGYRADLASNGVEAVQSVARQTYDLLFMDVRMPEMDGLEASREIVARWPAPHRPRIVAMTANALNGDRPHCLAAGMDEHLNKPLRLQELVDTLTSTPARTDA